MERSPLKLFYSNKTFQNHNRRPVLCSCFRYITCYGLPNDMFRKSFTFYNHVAHIRVVLPESHTCTHTYTQHTHMHTHVHTQTHTYVHAIIFIFSFIIPQTPHTCFPLTYNTTISNNGSTYNLGPFLYSGTGMEQITLSALQENAEYTATVSANNEFQFSTQSEEQAFCE